MVNSLMVNALINVLTYLRINVFVRADEGIVRQEFENVKNQEISKYTNIQIDK